jgi:hypothetical protein
MAQISIDGIVHVTLSDYEDIFVLKDCYVAFANGKMAKHRSAVEKAFNSVVNWWTGGVTHAEVAFEFIDKNDQVFLVACNLYLGEALKFEFKTRQYSNCYLWHLHRLGLNSAQKVNLFATCQKHVRAGLYFNVAMYWNFIVPLWLAYDGQLIEKAWCSEHVAHCLKAIGYPGFENVLPHRTDPGSLLQLIQRKDSLYGPLSYHQVKKNAIY